MRDFDRIVESEDTFDCAMVVLEEKAPSGHWLDLSEAARDLFSESTDTEVEWESPYDGLIAGLANLAASRALQAVDRALGLDLGTIERALDHAGFYVADDESERRVSDPIGWAGLQEAVNEAIDWTRRLESGEFDLPAGSNEPGDTK